ncbi:hypothetical protein BCV69DRAFT_295825 [Microstroma glucosiphilum]|uniref:Uncharacterized protein n=1 Tax=Pseudomicrostroma glucosiphilum TaxID=1684307 RepID=A0A316UHT7_9BASI|nr:hypothetical protein BCV69DRAFT_295825 [Pseudomicrostroma glucosiphilum]PWN23493.1 hypothetical protein BCV69DRAFT_295825 [Pseudomicrostroma glucosiphilum]
MNLSLWCILFLLQLFVSVSAFPEEVVSLAPRFKIIKTSGLQGVLETPSSSTAQASQALPAMDVAQSSESSGSPPSLAHLRTPSSTSSGTWVRTREGFSSLQTPPRTPGAAHTSPRSPSAASPPRLPSLHSEDFLSSLSSSPPRDRETPVRPALPARKKTAWWSKMKHVLRKPFRKCVGCVGRP